MSTETLGLLACIGVGAFILLAEIRRVHRLLDESIRAHHHAIAKIPELESQVRKLTKFMDRCERDQ